MKIVISQRNVQFFTILVIITLIPNGLLASSQAENNEDQSKDLTSVNENNNNEKYDNLAEIEQELLLEQRFKALLPYLYEAFLNANLQYDEDTIESDEIQTEKRSKYSKKESAFGKDFRRQQAARWDIGFGKRASSNFKSKSFMDALYGKRSGHVKHINPKISYGRKQQWDIQYGRK